MNKANNKTDYRLPDGITADMGGAAGQYDKRMADIIELLEDAPFDNLNTFLDIGLGNGQISVWLAKKGKKCTGTGLELKSYDINTEFLKSEYGIEIAECGVEKMPFTDKSFDGIIISHVLEHGQNIGLALEEVRRVLSDKGWLFIFVPPHESIICAGHVATGWSIGQLMYVLLVNGFDVKGGKFIQYGYNICAFVQKNLIPQPPLRGDRGDIHILNENNLFPRPIETKDGANDNFYGNIKAINWDPRSKIIKKLESAEAKKKKFILFSKIIPARFRLKAGNLLIKAGGLLKHDTSDESNNRINPDKLIGSK